MFKFGNGKRIKAHKTARIPIVLGSKKVNLDTDVVMEDIPLLFSRSSMKRANTQLDTSKDTVNMLGEKIKLIVTSTGHYAVPISRGRKILEDEAKINLLSVTPNLLYQIQDI